MEFITLQKFSSKKDPFYERERKKYPKPIPSREYIMQCMDKLGKSVTHEQLANAFSLKLTELKDALRNRLIAMGRDGQLITNRRGGFILASKASLVRGTVSGHKDGFGFLIPEDGGTDIFLPARQMRAALHNDRIVVRVVGKDRRGRPEGVIVEILEHNTKQITGRYFEENNVGFVVPENKQINQDIIIPKDGKISAVSGQLVVAEILNYPSLRRQGTGKIIEILGEHMAPGMEIEVAIRTYELPYKWPDEVLSESDELKRQFLKLNYSGRKDLRKLPLVTIDGEDAKDFDDAVYCEKRSKGGWRLYVAIADVSYYVQLNTALDQSALLRGNSVYFPGFVVPMLPEILSNDLCSLKPDVDRLCMVCEMAISPIGKIVRYQFYEAIMKSHARLTYNQVASMLKTGDGRLPEILPHLKELYSLFKVLHEQREKRGAIDFDTIETRIVFDKQRKIKQILPVKRNDAHRIIEECMLAANVCAANFLLKQKIPALYRVHESPSAEKLENLRSFLSSLGLQLGGSDNPKPLDYTNLLKQVRGRANEHLIQTVLLRSMRQAVYGAENIGHFGLAYEAYGHFTSPIRRYPDLLAHRAIKHGIAGGSLIDFYYDSNKVHNFGEHCSMTERRADDAVRDVTDWLKCEYMLDKVGQTFKGIISAVLDFGIFIELRDIYVEGLLHITSLANDYYEYDPTRHCLRGKRTGKKYCLGDPIRVKVARADLDDKQIDFVLG